MKLPFSEKACVDPRKITHYLLSEDHPAGGAKARFFLLNGFSRDRWAELAARLVEHGQRHGVTEVRTRPGGRLFAVTGPWFCSDDRPRTVITVWQLADDSDAPRLVTAYPG